MTIAGVVKRQRTKGWRKPEGAVYVGRPSRWSNPFQTDDKRDDTRRFLDWITGRLPRLYYARRREWILGHVQELRGVTLMGWCGDWEPGEPEIDCHAVLLYKMANGLEALA